MSARDATRVAAAAVVLEVAMIVALLALWVLNGFERALAWGTEAGTVLFVVTSLAYSLVGALLVSRDARNAVAWICLGSGLAVAFMELVAQYALQAIVIRPDALPAAATVAWIGQWSYLPVIALIGLYLVLLFPDGRLPSPRWRVVAWLGGLSVAIAGLSAATLAGPLELQPSIDNPYAVSGPELLGDVGFLGLLSCMIAAAVSMVRRMRRSAGAERQQLKWFAFAAGVLALVFVPASMLDSTDREALPIGMVLAQDLTSMLFAGLPIAVGIAITRYRLYDIDVVINRTLVYGALSATLAGTYLCGVLLLQLALSPLTESNGLAIAASTLAVAALFQPARRRIQATVDRRFYRQKYDAAQTLDRFGTHLRDEVDLEALGLSLRTVVAETMQPAHVTLWLRRDVSLVTLSGRPSRRTDAT